MQELLVEDVHANRNVLRMDIAMFEEVLNRTLPRITKQDTFYRKALTPALKLSFTLRYLASGDSYHFLVYGFRVPHNTISLAIREVCEAIIAEYADKVIQGHSKPQWRGIAEHFSTRWQFHHCLGALDGKQSLSNAQPKADLITTTTILVALVDGDYKLSWVDVGSNGSAGDAQVFNCFELKQYI